MYSSTITFYILNLRIQVNGITYCLLSEELERLWHLACCTKLQSVALWPVHWNLNCTWCGLQQCHIKIMPLAVPLIFPRKVTQFLNWCSWSSGSAINLIFTFLTYGEVCRDLPRFGSSCTDYKVGYFLLYCTLCSHILSLVVWISDSEAPSERRERTNAWLDGTTGMDCWTGNFGF